jgi:hypothetical protein
MSEEHLKRVRVAMEARERAQRRLGVLVDIDPEPVCKRIRPA